MFANTNPDFLPLKLQNFAVKSISEKLKMHS